MTTPGSAPPHALYRALFAAYPDALLLVDAGGHIVLANPQASHLLGYDNAELIGLPVDALVPDAVRPRHHAYRENYAHNPRLRPMGAPTGTQVGTQMALVAKRRDGSQVMVEIALSPLQDAGQPYVVAAVRGIEAYPRVQQALQRARYSEFVAQMGRLAVDTRDPQLLLHQTPLVAAQALQLDSAVVYLLEPNRLEFCIASGVGLAADEAIGSRIANRPDTLPGQVLAHGAALRVADVARERRFALPASWLAQGAVSACAVPLSDRGDTVGVICVRSAQRKAFDDDELRLLESLSNLLATSLQRAQSEEALNHAQRLESVGQLTGGIAHDFNNLLTVIQGNLQVLQDHPQVAGDDDAQQLLAAALRASRRAAELTAKLLAFSRRQVLSPSRIDVVALLGSTADMLQRTLDQRIRIRFDASAVPSQAGAPAPAFEAGAPSLLCRADAGQLESALLNLAINARDAMPEGGVLAFACRPCAQLPPELAAELGVADGAHAAYIEIDVADTGTGMPEAVRERAFEPFFTTKDAGRGTGLGLSTVYGFVKQSKGAIRLRTAPGAGTTVTLLLPSYFSEDAARAASTDRRAELPAGLRVLLVEDDAEVRRVVSQHLAALACSVTECASAEQALAALAALGPRSEHDLLLSDVALGPGLRGTELVRQVRQRWPGIALLLMSGYSTDLLQGQDLDPAELLHKPFERAELAQAMVRALAARGVSTAGASLPAVGGEGATLGIHPDIERSP